MNFVEPIRNPDMIKAIERQLVEPLTYRVIM